MRIVGLLAWYDEEPRWLYEACRSAMSLCDAVVALDGAYEGFPGGEAQSVGEQADAIVEACHENCTIKHPSELWSDQMAKRTALFRLGRTVTGPSDWYFVFDADDLVFYAATDVRDRLTRAKHDVAVYTLGGDRYHRGLFRAFRSLRVEEAHYHYVAERDGKTIHLRGNDAVHKLEPFLNLTDLRVQHRKHERAPERLAASKTYRCLVQERAIEKTTPEQWASVPA